MRENFKISITIILILGFVFYSGLLIGDFFGDDSRDGFECASGYTEENNSCEKSQELVLAENNFIAGIPNIIEACKKLGGKFVLPHLSYDLEEFESNPEGVLESILESIKCYLGTENSRTIYDWRENNWQKYSYFEYYDN